MQLFAVARQEDIAVVRKKEKFTFISNSLHFLMPEELAKATKAVLK